MRQVPRPEDYRNQSNDPRSRHPFSEPHTLRKGNLETKQSTRTVGNFVQQQRGFSFFFFLIYMDHLFYQCLQQRMKRSP